MSKIHGYQLYLSSFFITTIWATKFSGFPEVTTMYGRLRGRTIDFENGNKINTFLGVPYAKSPVGELRFKAPQQMKSWRGVFNATSYPDVCPQDKTEKFNEDCLYLNIYSPKEGGPYPVLVFIHGGGWLAGSSKNLDGHFLSQKGVVVVTINYRLLALGYLTTEDSAAPGNAGMLDQIAALEFVRDCIADFGGDPNKVTLFGHSSGAASTSLHLLSPRSIGLFHGAVLLSGADMAPWAMIDPGFKPKDYARYLAEELHCDTSDSMSMVACLRTKSSEDITAAAFVVISDVKNGSIHFPWSPVVDGPEGFLPDTPRSLRKQGKFAALPVFTGNTPNEMAYFLDFLEGMTREEFLDSIRLLTELIGVSNHEAIVNAIAYEFTCWPAVNDSNINRRNFYDIGTSMMFHAPNELVAKSQSQKAPTFMFNYDYLSVNDKTPSHMIGHHNAGREFWFGYPFHDAFTLNITGRGLKYNFTEEDKLFSNFTMTLLTNFVKFGSPTPEPVDGVKWPEFYQDCQQYLHLNHRPTVKKNYQHHRNAFVNDYIPTLLREENKGDGRLQYENFEEIGSSLLYHCIHRMANTF